MISLCGITISLIFLIFAFILNDIYSSFCTSEKICRNHEITFIPACKDERESDDHRNLSVWELKRVIEKEETAEIEGVFEEEEPSLMEVKEAFDVLDENKDGFIDADELRNALLLLGFVKEAGEDDCQKMIKRFDDNSDGRIDLNEFFKVLETSFCS
ncbi:hypothetical protein V6N13_035919 [Hibiscus sabdariffa]|uniref:EF-hand domain-containing protein n=1 Tax=Hibiscus sabdariffa TaxID=183260 RepID=A0ABR2S8I4_9ROSI